MFGEFVQAARERYGKGFIPLHRPVFAGNEKKYLLECIDSNFVSSVGSKVVDFECAIADYTGCKYGVAVVNGTSALQIALKVVGVYPGDEVLTQDLTFVATANAISHLNAKPIFLDVDTDSLGLCPKSLLKFLHQNCEVRGSRCINRRTLRKIAACVPMHTFGNPCRIDEIVAICSEWNIPVVEDAAEALGSKKDGKHIGKFGSIGVFSFNGNKIITTGGGGMIVTDNENFAQKAKHLTTTAKVPHSYEFKHDEIGYNYRMPNLNAALGCAQMEKLDEHIAIKRENFFYWKRFFELHNVRFVVPIVGTTSNHWLNSIQFAKREQRDDFLKYTNEAGVMTRPAWELMSRLDIYKGCEKVDTKNAQFIADTVVNIPSSVPDGFLLG